MCGAGRPARKQMQTQTRARVTSAVAKGVVATAGSRPALPEAACPMPVLSPPCLTFRHAAAAARTQLPVSQARPGVRRRAAGGRAGVAAPVVEGRERRERHRAVGPVRQGVGPAARPPRGLPCRERMSNSVPRVKDTAKRPVGRGRCRWRSRCSAAARCFTTTTPRRSSAPKKCAHAQLAGLPASTRSGGVVRTYSPPPGSQVRVQQGDSQGAGGNAPTPQR